MWFLQTAWTEYQLSPDALDTISVEPEMDWNNKVKPSGIQYQIYFAHVATYGSTTE